MSKKRQAEVEARLKEFWDDHKDFDSPWARNILDELTEVILPFVFKPSAVEIGLEQLYVKSGVRVPRELLYQPAETLTHARILRVRARLPYPIGPLDFFAMAVSVVARAG
jgi:hypothetical protein